MRKPGLALAALLVTGCVSMNTTTLKPDSDYAPVRKSEVRIFQGGDEVPEPWVKVALFNASGSHSFTDESDLYNKMREEAAKRGCNGVVLQGTEDAGTAEKIFFGSGADREAEGVCIRYGERVESSSDSTTSSSEDGEDGEGELPVIQL